MAGLYDSAADVLGVTGEPIADTGFSASEAVNFLTAPPEKDPRWVPDSPSPKEPAQERGEKPFLERMARQYVGGVETAATLATGAVAAPVGAAAGLVKGLFGGKYGTKEGAREAETRAAEVSQALTYQPRTEEGQAGVEQVSGVIDASKIAGLGPSEGVSLAGVMAGPRAVKPAAIQQQQAIPRQMASVGAAGATPAAQVEALVSRASPELQAVVQKVGPGKIKPAVLERYVESEALPVPVRISTGQATGDPVLISREQNRRGMNTTNAYNFNEQN
jgi:hypothetical protein